MTDSGIEADVGPHWDDACKWASAYCKLMFNKEWNDDSIAHEYMAARNGYLAGTAVEMSADISQVVQQLQGENGPYTVHQASTPICSKCGQIDVRIPRMGIYHVCPPQVEVKPEEPSGPFDTTVTSPFDHAAIMGDPGNRRISMSFSKQEQYEAALAFLDMGDLPRISERRR